MLLKDGRINIFSYNIVHRFPTHNKKFEIHTAGTPTKGPSKISVMFQ
jgi:hypothetical protein